MKKISLVGYGRFGKVLYQLLKDDFAVTLYRRSPMTKTDKTGFSATTKIATDLNEVYQSEVIFFATPIESFESVILSHQKYFRPGQLLIDVLSVKLHPAKVFKKYLSGTQVQALLTHPMFGPDSSHQGVVGLPIIMDQFTADSTNYKFWKNYFAGKKLRIVEMSAKEHDQLAANSQGLTHFVGRLLEAYGVKPTPIDSVGSQKLLEVKEQTCHDTWQLFTNLQQYNPYTAQMRLKLGEKFDELYNQLLPDQKNPAYVTYGIQGGIGSFNEEALRYYVQQAGIKNFKVKYLYTSEAVLAALHSGEIDRGQFAVHNSAGGVVEESIYAMAKYKFKIIQQFEIKISHALMIRADAEFSDIDTIMTHDQVLAQCQKTLKKKYPQLRQTSGEGDLLDHALVAKNLSEGKLSKNIAVMGSKVLAKIYGLKIIEDNLQDLKENDTAFLVVGRG